MECKKTETNIRKKQRKLMSCIAVIVAVLCLIGCPCPIVTAETVASVSPTAIDHVSISVRYLVLSPSESATITASTNLSSTIMWSSDDPSIATVSGTGKTATVRAKQSGFTTITASAGIVSQSIPVYINITGISGKYYVQNMQTARIMDIEGPSTSDGASIQQWNYSTAVQKKWVIAKSGNYFTIRSVYSGKYVGVASSSSGAAVKQYTDNTSTNTRWVITQTERGYHRLIPVSCLESGCSLSVKSGQDSNGTDLFIYPYTNNSDKRDEWYLTKLTDLYGRQVYRTENSTEINCHGYALQTNNWPNKYTVGNQSEVWYKESLAYMTANENVFISGSSSVRQDIRLELSRLTKIDFENWLDKFWNSDLGSSGPRSWEYESDFTGNGENRLLKPNQYRIVLRTGAEIDKNELVFDYHFWYQTSDGSWANKHGATPSEHLLSDTTPYSSDTPGWSVSYKEPLGRNSYGREYYYTHYLRDFYSGPIYSYIITIND